MNRWVEMLTRLGRAFLDWVAEELEQLAEELYSPASIVWASII